MQIIQLQTSLLSLKLAGMIQLGFLIIHLCIQVKLGNSDKELIWEHLNLGTKVSSLVLLI